MKLFKCGKTMDGTGQNWWDIKASLIYFKELRYVGPRKSYFNGDVYAFGLWFFHVSLKVVTKW
jgi:hypothetical protein